MVLLLLSGCSMSTMRSGGNLSQSQATPTPFAGLHSDQARIAGSYYHFCALSLDGRVYCWGDNVEGALGDGTTADRDYASLVPGLTSVAQVVSANYASCALLGDQTVRCWGSQYSGRLGNGQSTGYSASPVTVSGLSGVRALVAGEEHFCALKSDGSVHCWGSNSSGQLGDGTTADAASPVAVSGLAVAESIAAVSDATCALLADRTVRCWGANWGGELGDGTFTDSATPVPVSGLSEVAAISGSTVGIHFCALRMDQSVRCWGYNSHGEIGDGTTTDAGSPVTPIGLPPVKRIFAGGERTCALDLSGLTWCWGYGGYGALGDGGSSDQKTPVQATQLGSGVSEIGGADTLCYLKADENLSCLGSNYKNLLADEKRAYRIAPQPVHFWKQVTPTRLLLEGSGTIVRSSCSQYRISLADADGVIAKPASPLALSASVTGSAVVYTDETCATPSGSVSFAAGASSVRFFVKDPVSESFTVSVSGAGLTGASLPVASASISKVSAGQTSGCLLMSNGKVLCWGANSTGQLGEGTGLGSVSPMEVTGLSQAVEVQVGYTQACARTSSSGLFCWGENSGQFGVGDSLSRFEAVQVPVTNVSAFAMGHTHLCVISGGAVKCAGSNDYGQLGNGTTTNSTTFVPVTGISNAISIAAGARYSCAVLSTGAIKCWGINWTNQLGNGSTTDSPLPVDVSGITDAVSVATAGANTCARLLDGSVKCWGIYYYGVIGVASPVFGEAPPTTVGGLSNVVDLRMGYNHACGLDNVGSLKCWGDNRAGQLGNGTSQRSVVPASPTGLSGVLSFGGSWDTTCAYSGGDTVQCWGASDRQSADDRFTVITVASAARTTPSIVPGITAAVGIEAGYARMMAVLSDGTIRGWGDNDIGQIGDGTRELRLSPVAVTGINAIDVSTDSQKTCSAQSDGSLKCWGQVNQGFTTQSPATIGSYNDVVQVVVDANNGCLRRVGGTVECWGWNGEGAVGDGTTNPVWMNGPTAVSGLTGAVHIGGDGWAWCAALTNGTVKCWGRNMGATGDTGIATPVSGITNALRIGYTPGGISAYLSDGSVVRFNRTTAEPLPDYAGAVSVRGLNGSEFMLRPDGTIRARGWNQFGQNGDGTVGIYGGNYSSSWATVSGISTAVEIAVGNFFACARLSSGQVACWGKNSTGQLGLGTSDYRFAPVTLPF